MDEGLHLVEHAVDYRRKLGERIIRFSMRKPFTQVSSDNALNPLINFYYALPGPGSQRCSDRNTKRHNGSQTNCERPANDTCKLADFLDISSHHQHVAVRQGARDQA